VLKPGGRCQCAELAVSSDDAVTTVGSPIRIVERFGSALHIIQIATFLKVTRLVSDALATQLSARHRRRALFLLAIGQNALVKEERELPYHQFRI